MLACMINSIFGGWMWVRVETGDGKERSNAFVVDRCRGADGNGLDDLGCALNRSACQANVGQRY